MLNIGVYTNKDKDPGLHATRKVIEALEMADCSICYLSLIHISAYLAG